MSRMQERGQNVRMRRGLRRSFNLWGDNGAEASRREKITGSGICSIGSSFPSSPTVSPALIMAGIVIESTYRSHQGH